MKRAVLLLLLVNLVAAVGLRPAAEVVAAPPSPPQAVSSPPSDTTRSELVTIVTFAGAGEDCRVVSAIPEGSPLWFSDLEGFQLEHYTASECQGSPASLVRQYRRADGKLVTVVRYSGTSPREGATVMVGGWPAVQTSESSISVVDRGITTVVSAPTLGEAVALALQILLGQGEG